MENNEQNQPDSRPTDPAWQGYRHLVDEVIPSQEKEVAAQSEEEE